MATISISRKAQRQLRDILDFLEKRAGDSIARQHEADFDDLFDRLTRTPKIGANRSNLAEGLKMSIVSRYLVFHTYDADKDEVEIMLIRDGSRRAVKPSDFLKKK